MKFDDSLQQFLEAKEESDGLTAREGRLLSILQRPKSNRRRQRIVGQLEGAARADLGNLGQASVDWSEFDWDKFLAFFAKLIELIMKLFS